MRTVKIPLATITFCFVIALVSLSLTACGGSSQQAGGAEDEASPAAGIQTSFQWSADADCATCHAKETASATDSSCQLANGHADVKCVSCHSDTGALTSAHNGVSLSDTKGTKKLSKTEVPEEACKACHSDGGAPEVTAGVTILTDEKGTTVNPHDLPVNEDHAKITCANCHDMHSGKSTDEAAKATCLSCHHKNVYECNTCH